MIGGLEATGTVVGEVQGRIVGIGDLDEVAGIIIASLFIGAFELGSHLEL